MEMKAYFKTEFNVNSIYITYHPLIDFCFRQNSFSIRLSWDHEICKTEKNSETLVTLEITKTWLAGNVLLSYREHSFFPSFRDGLSCVQIFYRPTISENLRFKCYFLRNHWYTDANIKFTNSRLVIFFFFKKGLSARLTTKAAMDSTWHEKVFTILSSVDS